MTQRDAVLRWIEQVARVIARLLNGPGPADLDLAADQVESALAQHLGAMTTLLPQLDVATAASLLHEPERIFGYAQLLGLLGAVQHARGEVGAAETHWRAVGLAREALRRAPQPPGDWLEWVAEAERWPSTGARQAPDASD